MTNPLLEQAKNIYGKTPDVVDKQIICCNKNLSLLFCKSMINEDFLISGILKPILEFQEDEVSIEILKNKILSTANQEIISDKSKLEEAIIAKKVLLFIEDEAEKCLAIDIVNYPVRLPSEPPTSAVIKGPREGFVEDLKTNVTLLRRRLMSENFDFEEMSVGKYTKTKVVVAYIKGIAKKSIYKSIINKIKKINIDGVVDSSYIINFLEQKKNSIFRQVGTSEKPDIVVAKLLEGRVAILVNNSPIVLTVPFLYIEDIQSSNDYYSNSNYTTFIRIIRLIGIFVSIIIPGFYLSLRFYHYNLVPFKFLVTIANSTQTIPFTPFLEIAFILILFQILYEVSLRLPHYLGLATSIVGALILGDTGVKAGLISPPGVMIIALSIISIYIVPDQADQLNLIRAVFIILGSGFGMFGIISGIVFIICYLNSLQNYGSPYLAPLAPIVTPDLKDALYKTNLTNMMQRPKSIPNKNKVRLRK